MNLRSISPCPPSPNWQTENSWWFWREKGVGIIFSRSFVFFEGATFYTSWWARLTDPCCIGGMPLCWGNLRGSIELHFPASIVCTNACRSPLCWTWSRISRSCSCGFDYKRENYPWIDCSWRRRLSWRGLPGWAGMMVIFRLSIWFFVIFFP